MPRTEPREIPSFVYDPYLAFYIPLWKRDGAAFISDDASGHLCTVTEATWGTQGRTFDGSNDFISVAHNANLNFTTNATIWFWVKLLANAPANGGYVFSKGYFTGAGDNGEYIFYFGAGGTTGNVDFRGDSLATCNTGALGLNTWAFVTCTYEASTAIRAYVNTILVSSDITGIPALLKNDTSALNLGRLGRAAASTYQNMVLGEIGGVSRTLALPEITQIYNATSWRYI